jgi:lysophospholipase L1-like esterase
LADRCSDDRADPLRGRDGDGRASPCSTRVRTAGAVLPRSRRLDWLPFLLEDCKNDVACARERGPSAVASFGSRLSSILQRLRAAAPTAEIIVTGAWNFDPKELDQLQPIYRSLDASIARAASASRSRVAEGLPVFNAAGRARAQLCALTFICSKGDPHPTDAGYRALADALMTASGYRREP